MEAGNYNKRNCSKFGMKSFRIKGVKCDTIYSNQFHEACRIQFVPYSNDFYEAFGNLVPCYRINKIKKKPGIFFAVCSIDW